MVVKIEAATRLLAGLMRQVTTTTVKESSLWEKFQLMGLSLGDAKMYAEWTHSGVFYLPPGKAAKYLDMFTRLGKALPKEHRDVAPSEVYRGFGMPAKYLDKFEAGEDIALKEKVLSSWTASKKAASDYAHDFAPRGGFGIVVTAKTKNVVIYIGPKTQKYLGKTRDLESFEASNKSEVIIRGTLVTSVSKDNAKIKEKR